MTPTTITNFWHTARCSNSAKVAFSVFLGSLPARAYWSFLSGISSYPRCTTSIVFSCILRCRIPSHIFTPNIYLILQEKFPWTLCQTYLIWACLTSVFCSVIGFCQRNFANHQLSSNTLWHTFHTFHCFPTIICKLLHIVIVKYANRTFLRRAIK